MKKTLVIESRNTYSGNYFFTTKGEEEKLKRVVEDVLQGGRNVYLETDTKETLVLTKELLENSLVYFVED